MNFEAEISRRRTFGIISHPDAGKTTLTEKLLLFGGAINIAGAVKSNKIKKVEQVVKKNKIPNAESYLPTESIGINPLPPPK